MSGHYRGCPGLASRGFFKYLTYIIPVKECQSTSGQNFFVWLLIKLQEAVTLLCHYISLVPVGTITNYLQNLNFESAIFQNIVSKCSFFVTFVKPAIDKIAAYFTSSQETAGDVVEEEPVVVPKTTVEKPAPVEKPPIVEKPKVEPPVVQVTQCSLPTETARQSFSAEGWYDRFFKPFKNGFQQMQDLLRGTGIEISQAGSKAYGYVVGCPTWVYAYIFFVALSVTYILTEAYITYRGRIWARHHKVPTKIREGCKDFILPDTTLREVMGKLRTEIDKGLNPRTKQSSSVKCFTTYVQDLPTGKENGRFLALDLGGTNFRVLLITLNGRHFDMQSKIYAIPQNVMVGTSQNLFAHIAQCLLDFTKEHKVNKEKLALGFTFSFPLRQDGLSKGVLQRWTKGFNCPEAVGKDVVELLKEAVAVHQDLQLDIMAILNDTTGTLMSCAWKNHNCKIGVILGTGTNACYVEKIENVIDFDGDKSKPIVLVNTEWGAFGDNGELEFIRTPYDKEVDKNSINPGLQKHEKLISGMYLGEIVRLLVVKFVTDKLLLEGKFSAEIQKSGSFPTELLSEIESDKRGVFKNCRKALAKVGYSNVNDEDCNSIRYICECVSRRAAHLASAGLATLINKMGYPSLTIGVDGSLYRYHPHFHDLMVEKISQLIDDRIMEFGLMVSTDGSGRGAALVAASALTNRLK